MSPGAVIDHQGHLWVLLGKQHSYPGDRNPREDQGMSQLAENVLTKFYYDCAGAEI